MDFARRRAGFSQAIDSANAAAYLASSPATMTYLHGFTESGGERFLCLAFHADGRVALICPALSENQARRSGIGDIRPWRDGEDPLALFAGLVSEWSLDGARLLVDDDMTAGQLLAIQSVVPGATVEAGHGVRAQLMSRKDEVELDLLRQAGEIADAAFEQVIGQMKPGMTERQVAALLFDAMSARGGQPTFAIIGAGAGGAEPHHHTDDTVLAEGDLVIMDFGCQVEGYQSDITRTVSMGEPKDADADKIYATVLEAHLRARDYVKPGAAFRDADRQARAVIEAAGYGPQFPHRTGHGVGMSVHEKPDVSPSETAMMAEGNCFSIEPGIYLEGRFGVRIENLYSCSKDGAVSFNAGPPERLLRV